MSAAKGVLWIGTSVGYVLTLPLPRLQGVPQIHGRPNVSLHCQNSPVEFLITVSCSTVKIEDFDRIPTVFVDAVQFSAMKLKSSQSEFDDHDEDIMVKSFSSIKDEEDDILSDEDKPRWNSMTDLDSVELIYEHLCHDTCIQTSSSVLKNTMPRDAPGLKFGRKISKRFKKHEHLLKKVRIGHGKKINNLRLNIEKNSNQISSTPISPTSPVSSMSPDRNQIQMINKSLIVASGGQGHRQIGQGNSAKKSKIRQDDICLLLWQCRI